MALKFEQYDKIDMPAPVRNFLIDQFKKNQGVYDQFTATELITHSFRKLNATVSVKRMMFGLPMNIKHIKFASAEDKTMFCLQWS